MPTPEEIAESACRRIYLQILSDNRRACELIIAEVFESRQLRTVDRQSFVEELELPEKTTELLRRNGLSKVGELCSLSICELLDIRLLGPDSVRRIVSALARAGLFLRDNS